MASAWNAYPQNFQGARQAPAVLAALIWQRYFKAEKRA
jgi:hypothetical protein